MAKSILHMLTPGLHVSPFDVAMAVDAGFDVIVPYTGVALGEVASLVQDAMFARAPGAAGRTGMFIGGRDVFVALDMLEVARAALQPPHAVSLFADPVGAFTAAAATVALLERGLASHFTRALAGLRVAVVGATGPVGTAVAMLAAKGGADVRVVAHRGVERLDAIAAQAGRRYGVRLQAVDGSSADLLGSSLADAEVVITAASAGTRALDAASLAGAHDLLLALDLNVVAPAGIEGVDPHARAGPLRGGGVLGMGGEVIGEVKNATERALLGRMLASRQAVALGIDEALEAARAIVASGIPPADDTRQAPVGTKR